jgi:hypothetical protein
MAQVCFLRRFFMEALWALRLEFPLEVEVLSE